MVGAGHVVVLHLDGSGAEDFDAIVMHRAGGDG